MPAVFPPHADPPELVFQWEQRSYAHWRLLLILVGSLLAHAASFYILQVSYTPTGSEPPPPAQVFMVPMDGSNGESAARWLSMTDPALLVQPAPPSPADTLAKLDFRYVPSFENARPGYKPLDPLPEESSVANPPRPRPPGPVPVNTPVAPAAPKVPATEGKSPTRVFLSGNLASRLAGPLSPVTYRVPADGKKLLEPTSFLVGIRPEGGAPFLFLRAGSDNPAAEDYARAYLARLKFRPAESSNGGVDWGQADFAWGSDVYR